MDPSAIVPSPQLMLSTCELGMQLEKNSGGKSQVCGGRLDSILVPGTQDRNVVSGS